MRFVKLLLYAWGIASLAAALAFVGSLIFLATTDDPLYHGPCGNPLIGAIMVPQLVCVPCGAATGAFLGWLVFYRRKTPGDRS